MQLKFRENVSSFFSLHPLDFQKASGTCTCDLLVCLSHYRVCVVALRLTGLQSCSAALSPCTSVHIWGGSWEPFPWRARGRDLACFPRGLWIISRADEEGRAMGKTREVCSYARCMGASGARVCRCITGWLERTADIWRSLLIEFSPLTLMCTRHKKCPYHQVIFSSGINTHLGFTRCAKTFSPFFFCVCSISWYQMLWNGKSILISVHFFKEIRLLFICRLNLTGLMSWSSHWSMNWNCPICYAVKINQWYVDVTVVSKILANK